MKSEVRTTITTQIDVDSFDTETTVVVEPDDEVPQELAWALTIVGAKAYLLNLLVSHPQLTKTAIRDLAQKAGFKIDEETD